MSDDIKELEKWLKVNCFYTDGVSNQHGYNSKYEDNYIQTDDKITAAITCARLFRVGLSEGKPAYQAVLDIQGNVTDKFFPSLIEAEENDLLKIGELLNDMLFISFIKYITKDYITSHKK